MEFEKLQNIIAEVLNIEPEVAEQIVSVSDAIEQIKNALN